MDSSTTGRGGRTTRSLGVPSATPSDPPAAGLAGVILCGGSGTRMGRTRTHKVCVPVAGRPAVVRLIDTLRADGVDPLVIVVGHNAGDVVETVGAAHPGVHFVYQRDRLGTGHAARIGVEALARFGYAGNVLVTMGDKWFEPRLIRNSFARFQASRADLLVVGTPKPPESSGGRLVHLPGRGVVGIVEQRDIERSRVLRDWLDLASRKTVLSRADLRRAGLKRIAPEKKLWRALGRLARFARGTGSVRAQELIQSIREIGTRIAVGGVQLEPDQVERQSPTINQSVYIGNIAVLQAALHRIGRANAQDEYYLTDIIELIASGTDGLQSHTRPRVVEHQPGSSQVMAFNTRRELKHIEESIRTREQHGVGRTADRQLARYARTPEQWSGILAGDQASRLVERTYGIVDAALTADRLRAFRNVLRLFAKAHGAGRKAFLVRAPGRINLMGRHIDHQGGFVHAMALDREVVMAVAPRSDDIIRMVNADAVAFPPRELVINDWRPALATPDWLNFVDGREVRAHLLSTAGDWSNYILASVLYQQHRLRDQRIRGMDIAVHGNVPMAAGLSSSSALVVSAMEAVTAVNGIPTEPSDIVTWSGQAEWFVGSRGGAADHAAIRLGRAGHVAKMGFHPFSLSCYVPIPPEAAVLVAYSGQHAVKSAGVRDRFNERVACYRLGILLLRHQCRRLVSRLEHIRDLSPGRLGISPAEVRAMIGRLPVRITRRQIRSRLGASATDQLDRIFSSHSDPGEHTIREVVEFGVGECERSQLAASLLEQRDLLSFGRLMQLSHDGDRVNGRAAVSDHTCGDGSATDSGPLWNLIGRYACSTENIDRLVDIALKLPGVYGAQLAGAGLGGCAMILVKRSAAAKVKAALKREYYDPRNMMPAVWLVRSACGGGIIQP